jgi:hypothetical protein
VKLLLTSAGIKNASIRDALVDLLGKPIAESSALCIPTATYPISGPGSAWRFITGRATTPMCELGWKSLGVLELTALPSIGTGNDRTLGLVDFSIFPHLDHETGVVPELATGANPSATALSIVQPRPSSKPRSKASWSPLARAAASLPGRS